MRPRSPRDREILRLAALALPALAAEPTYLLADTAIVGHLGTRQLAALALAAAVLGAATALCNFPTYGTTAQVARRRRPGARGPGPRGAGLALAVGVGLAGQGWLRGTDDLGRALRIVVAANVLDGVIPTVRPTAGRASSRSSTASGRDAVPGATTASSART